MKKKLLYDHEWFYSKLHLLKYFIDVLLHLGDVDNETNDLYALFLWQNEDGHMIVVGVSL